MDNWEIEFLKAMRGLSKLYGKAIDQDLLEIYRHVLRPLTAHQLVLSVRLWVDDPKHVFFPLPAQLKALALPTMDPEDEASILSEKLNYAIQSYGDDAEGERKAREKLSGAAWQLVEISGGWGKFSRSVVSNADLPTAKAQWRKAIKGLLIQRTHERQKEMLPNGSSNERLPHSSGGLDKLGVSLPKFPS